MNKVVITHCIECNEWIPADSYGCGTYCDELQEVISETDPDIAIPDNCPKIKAYEDRESRAVELLKDAVGIMNNIPKELRLQAFEGWIDFVKELLAQEKI